MTALVRYFLVKLINHLHSDIAVNIAVISMILVLIGQLLPSGMASTARWAIITCLEAPFSDARSLEAATVMADRGNLLNGAHVVL